MQFQRAVKPKKINLNLTSLIDVMFLLIIFFMSTTQYQIYDHVPLELSTIEEEKEANMPNDAQALVVNVAPNQAFMWKGKLHKLTSLPEVLAKLIKQENAEAKDLQILLTSQKGTNTQDILKAMQYIKQAGVVHISLLEPEK